MKYIIFALLALSLAACSTHFSTDFGVKLESNQPVVEESNCPTVGIIK